MGITDLIGLILDIPAVRDLVRQVAMEVVHEVLAKRFVDPQYASNQDAILTQLAAATTPEEKANAQKKLRALMLAD